MMENLVEELKSVIKGQVLSDDESLNHYSTDGSVFEMKPWAVVLPASKDDVVSLVKWVKHKKESVDDPAIKEKLSITCRGKATDQAGGPVNDGIILRFPGYLDKILEIGEDFVRVEPGAVWGDVFEKLAPSGRYIPPYPASYKFATFGGGVANNCGGEKTVKYGSIREWVEEINMVLEDGSEVVFKNIHPDELIKIQASDTLEGKIYREMSDLIIGNYNLIHNYQPKANKISSGYWLIDVVGEDGGFDLTRLISGSQGTLGIVTEIKLKTIKRAPLNGLILFSFNDLEKAGEAVPKIAVYHPSALEMIDKFLIEMLQKEKPDSVKTIMEGRSEPPALILMAEFEGDNMDDIKKTVAEVKEKVKGLAFDVRDAYEKAEQDKLWEARRIAANVAEGGTGPKKALPFIEDSAVPPENLAAYLAALYEIMKKYQVDFSVWGHAGNGNLHLQPFLNLSESADKEKLFNIAKEVYAAALKLGGTLSAEHNDGLMRAPFLPDEFGPLYKVFEQVKNIFDPLDIMNPHKKIGVSLDFVAAHVRKEYNIEISTPKS
ncbi:MAG: FAD-binding oxidoreductase [Patescibacteria group bacterium]|nr:FAD-binding oxidoreductase [Patescibacteria group bacterium]